MDRSSHISRVSGAGTAAETHLPAQQASGSAAPCDGNSAAAAGKRKRRGNLADNTASYKPQTHIRRQPIVPASSAVLFIDTQKYNCDPSGALYAASRADQHEYFWAALSETVPRWKKLLTACRASGVEVLFTVIQSLTMDGRDMSLDYKISGFHVPPGSRDAEVLDEIAPVGDEIVLPKTSCNVFVSTNIDYILRSLGVKQLILCGCITDQCVDAAVRNACDLGYLVTMVTDACVTYSRQRQSSAVAALSGFCRQMSTDELTSELADVDVNGS